MRFLRLLLQAYGPFTNKVVDFSIGHPNLHLIYGPNEAGKSSALRAMIDLRFGIPPRSSDGFVHAAGDLLHQVIYVSAGFLLIRRESELAWSAGRVGVRPSLVLMSRRNSRIRL